MTAWQFFGWAGIVFYGLAYHSHYRQRSEDFDFHFGACLVCWIAAAVIVIVGIFV